MPVSIYTVKVNLFIKQPPTKQVTVYKIQVGQKLGIEVLFIFKKSHERNQFYISDEFFTLK